MKNRREGVSDRRREDAEAAPSYFFESRGLGLSVVLMLPLFVLYQVGIVQCGSTARNIAEVWMMRALGRLGMPAGAVINGLALAALLYALWKLERTGSISFVFVAAMLLESVLYAAFMFKTITVVAAIAYKNMESFLILKTVPWTQVWLSIGAGVYEELLFRLLLIGGGVLIVRKVFLWNAFWSSAAVLVASSLLFSAAHHVGPAAEQFDTFVFLFRTLCGMVLGVIFITRGLGIAAWTHAIYNVLVLWTSL